MIMLLIKKNIGIQILLSLLAFVAVMNFESCSVANSDNDAKRVIDEDSLVVGDQLNKLAIRDSLLIVQKINDVVPIKIKDNMKVYTFGVFVIGLICLALCVLLLSFYVYLREKNKEIRELQYNLDSIKKLKSISCDVNGIKKEVLRTIENDKVYSEKLIDELFVKLKSEDIFLKSEDVLSLIEDYLHKEQTLSLSDTNNNNNINYKRELFFDLPLEKNLLKSSDTDDGKKIFHASIESVDMRGKLSLISIDRIRSDKYSISTEILVVDSDSKVKIENASSFNIVKYGEIEKVNDDGIWRVTSPIVIEII